MFNQDETGFNCCPNKNTVLAPKGHSDVIYQRQPGNPRENVSVSVCVNAAGEVADTTVIYDGVYNCAKKHLQDMPKDGCTGEWKFTNSKSGYMTRETFLEVLQGQ